MYLKSILWASCENLDGGMDISRGEGKFVTL